MMSGRHLASTARAGTGDRVLSAVLVTAILLVMALGYGLIDNRWYRVLSVAGGSMEPAIDRGDAIVLVRPPDRLEVGDVVTLQANDTLVTHRVVAVAPDGSFKTKGDANDSVDDWTGVKVRVVGRVFLTIPWLGSALAAFGSNAFFHDAASRPADVIAGDWGLGLSEAEIEEDSNLEDVPASQDIVPTSTVTTESAGDTVPTDHTEDTSAYDEETTPTQP
jgi:signal peptidase I